MQGGVQGVGFRPFVYRLAHDYGLVGWVRNNSGQVEIVAQGRPDSLTAFADALVSKAPPLACPKIAVCIDVEPLTADVFSILESTASAPPDIHVPPDYFVCDDCLSELRNPADRRYRYPFINCTQCGPRYSIIKCLPYDRPNTTMADFRLCPPCRAEYENPLNRRFHAQPNACPDCGPQLLFSGYGSIVNDSAKALCACIEALRRGDIVAVKGVGGYHLMCDAQNDNAVKRLRADKPRPHKPLAVMFPMDGGLATIRQSVVLNAAHEMIISGPVRPIVLVPLRASSRLSNSIAPGLNEIGAMLPYSPLHYLLLEEFNAPLVATSANVSGEPVLTERNDVEILLDHVADAFLHHNRPIERPADDPVFRVIANRSRPLRTGRGCAPVEIALPFTLAKPVLAVGGHIKNTVALAWDKRAIVSPHNGDLSSPRSMDNFEKVIHDLQRLYHVQAQQIVCDAHPHYASSRWALRTGLPVTSVYHHFAHASALAAEYPDIEKWLMFTWDGVGYGADGTLWGGETLLGHPGHWQHVATFRPFYPPGGDKAALQPWRSALALCWQAGVTWSNHNADTGLLYKAWQQRINCPQTSAVGRLFDAAAALTGVTHTATYEAQAPMMLEAIADGKTGEPIMLPLVKNSRGIMETDWAPLLPDLMNDRLDAGQRAADFHSSLAHSILTQAHNLRIEHSEFTIGLSGGVFQNRLLTEQAIALLNDDGFDVRLAEKLPCNDAGLSFGQLIEAGVRM